MGNVPVRFSGEHQATGYFRTMTGDRTSGRNFFKRETLNAKAAFTVEKGETGVE